ncbi:sister chromatid cohesion protein 1 [Tilletia horrida]|nr:sister chromatid cohesion protein 1 [Tilletia horrida]
MFYSDVVLTKRGPLARVWLAAHWERKLSKTQYLQADVAKSVEAMLGQGTAPMALRLSGQLLLGIVRIYSRKAKYLLDDCNDTLVKIKMAFRAGGVDLTSDQLIAPKNTITLQPNRTEFDLLMPDRLWQAWNVDPYLQKSLQGGNLDPNRARSRSRSATPARALSLRPSERAFAQGGFGIFTENQSDFGLDSQDYENSAALDLGMDEDIAAAERSRTTNRRSLPNAPRERGISTGLGLGADRPRMGSVDDSLSIGVGRDAAPDAGMASFGSMLGGDYRDGNIDFGFEDQPDLGLSFGGDDMPDLDLGFGQDPQFATLPAGGPHDGSSVRASTPEAVEDSFQKALANVTPRTAAKIREAAERRQQTQGGAAGTKSRRQIVDRFTELADSNAAQNLLMQWAQGRYVPSSRIDLELMSVRRDPAPHFFPWFDPSSKDSTSFCFASSALAPELMDLFTVDLTTVQRKRAAAPSSYAGSEAGRSAKRLRAHASDDGDLESEVGRRADPLQELSFAPFGDDHGGLDFGMGDNDAGLDFSMGQDEHVGLDAFGLGPLDQNDDRADLDQDGEGGALRRSLRKASQGGVHAEEDENRLPLGRLSTLTRLSTPELGEGDFRELSPSPDNPLAAFAARPSDAQGDSQSQQNREGPSGTHGKSGLSRNTVRAVKILQSQLQRTDDADDSLEEVDEESTTKKTMSFEEVSSKATRRAAAGFFFELLVLATKDCVKIKQEESYGDVEVEAKNKLWELAV